MPEIFRSFSVVLFIAIVVFSYAKAPLTERCIPETSYSLRKKLWIGITAAVFLTHNFWIFAATVAALLIYAKKRDPNTIGLTFSVLFTAPLFSGEIPGLGIINYFFDLNYFRLISLILLIPASLQLRKERDTLQFGATSPDKLLIGYIALALIMQLSVDTFTSTARSAFYMTLDIVLPYYVASRATRTLPVFKDTLASFVTATMILAGIGFFEFSKGWLLYSNIPGALGLDWGLGSYLLRGDNLRALASTGQAIVLGYVLSVSLGFYLYIKRQISSNIWILSGYALIIAGLIAPLSRGPWVGALVTVIAFVMTGKKAASQIMRITLPLLAAFCISLLTPFGAKILDHLPFIGSVDADNVIYRERLFTNSITVISRNPLFGSFDFMSTPEMQELKFTYDGGIIDLVNSYIAIALSGGLVALGLFVGFFVSIWIRLLQSIRIAAKIDNNVELLGRSLLATLTGILVTIYTVSSISFIPIVYWFVAGLCAAYIQLIQKQYRQ